MMGVSVIAHLSACSYVLRGKALEIGRNQVRLSISALQAFQRIWPLGQRTLSEVKTNAREVLFSQIPDSQWQSEPILPEGAPGFPDFLSWSSALSDLNGSGADWDLLEM